MSSQKRKQVAIAIQEELSIKLKPLEELDEEVIDLNLVLSTAD